MNTKPDFIQVKRSGAQVIMEASIRTDWQSRAFQFSFNAGQEWAAELLSSTLREQLDQVVMKIREQSYNEGFNDHKKRKPKRQYFYRALNVIE